jgi:hypothetical protein
MVGNAESHCWRAAQRLMNAADIIECNVQADGREVTFDALPKAIGKPREPL